ncbi:MAG: urease accessory protein UreD [Pseudomonadota bacterium]
MSFDAVSGAAEPHLRLEIARSEAGFSRIRRHRATFPWSFARGFRAREGVSGAVLAIPQTAGAGVFGGETVSQQAVLGPESALRWHVPGALMIHPGRENGLESRLDQRFSLAERASMTLEGEPCALLPGAFLHLETTVEAETGARFLGFDGVCAARGDAEGHGFRLVTRVTAGGGEAFEDRQEASPAAAARLSAQGWRAFGTVLAVVEGVHGLDGPLDLGSGVYAGAAHLRRGAGFAIRIAARDGGALRRAGQAALKLAAKATGM